MYACAYNWADLVRKYYEQTAGTGNAAKYSDYVASNPLRWPQGVVGESGSPSYPSKPSISFSLDAAAGLYPGSWYGGYPSLGMTPNGPCFPASAKQSPRC